MAEFCCQAARKLWEMTDPYAPLPLSFCGTCANCGQPEPYTYWVPTSLWRKILPRQFHNEVICAMCFHAFAVAPPPLEKGGE